MVAIAKQRRGPHGLGGPTAGQGWVRRHRRQGGWESLRGPTGAGGLGADSHSRGGAVWG